MTKPDDANAAAEPTVETIAGILRDRISRRDLLPGSKLRETELAKEFGVNRARVRQALFTLQQRGLVDHVQNRGASVASMDADKLFRIYDVFELLEGLSARLATQNAPGGSWDDLAKLFDKPMGKAVAECNYDTFFGGIETYRARVIKAAANPLLAEVLSSIYDQTQFIIRRVLILPKRAELSLAEHRAIISAMQRGDAAEAERLKLENMRTAREFLQKYQSFVL